MAPVLLDYDRSIAPQEFFGVPQFVLPNGCILWGGRLDQAGYGVFKETGDDTTRYAHRVAYELSHGPLNRWTLVDHRCHNKWCVNVDHLRPVSQKQNQEHRKGANRNSLTGVRGVTFDARRNQYRVRIKHNYKEVHVGRFDTLEEARMAADEARRKLFTHSDFKERAA